MAEINMKLTISVFTILVMSLTVSGQKYERYKPLSDTLLYSKSLGYGKKISITVPKEYQSNTKEKSFPLIIIFDSQNQRSYNYIIRTIDYLTSNEQMPASIIVGVESNQESRYNETQLELSDKTAFGSKNELFIFDELIPFIQNNHKANNFNLLIGHSRYGYFSSLMLTKHYSELNAVISISPFMSQKNINLTDSISNLYSQYSLERTLYYRYGIGNDYPEDFKELELKLNIKNRVTERANFKGYLFTEADHNATPGLTIGTALYEIFEFWSKQQNAYINNENKNINSSVTLSDKISDHYGVSLKFSLGILNGKGWYFFNKMEYLQSIDAWDQLVKEYPVFSEVYLNIIEAQKELNQDYTETLKQFKESLATTKFYAQEEILELQKELNELEKYR